jgi:hypothetical protein
MSNLRGHRRGRHAPSYPGCLLLRESTESIRLECVLIMKYDPITHVAIRFQGRIYSLPSPNRHHDVIRKIVEETGVASIDGEERDQGFLDSNGMYLTRKQALLNAEKNDQLRPNRPVYHNQLFSENLW